MDSLQIIYFEEVAKTENFTRAAAQLCISQSALSQTVGRLEKELGYPLFERRGKKILLNESGKIFLAGIGRMKHEMSNTLRQLEEANGKAQSQVSLYMGCASLYLPKLLRFLHTQCASTTFLVQQMQQDVISPETDLSIISSRKILDETEEYHTRLLVRERILLVVPKEHPLADKERVFPADLEGEEFIALNQSWMLGSLLDEEWRKRGISPNITISVDNPSIMREMLSNRQGLAFIPEKTWREEFKDADFVLREVEGMDMERFIYLQWKKNLYLTAAMKDCIRYIEEFFAEIQ